LPSGALPAFRELSPGEKFYYVLHPHPTVLVISLCEGGKVNAMPASWVVPLSEEPPAIGVAVSRESFTHECLEKTGQATINVPGPEHVDLVYSLGTVSGREVDKVKAFGLRLERGKRVGAPYWLDALAVLECSVIGKLEVGETTFFALEVKGVMVREGLYTKYGWDFSKTSLLLHGAGKTFFKVGPVLRAKKLEPKA